MSCSGLAERLPESLQQSLACLEHRATCCSRSWGMAVRRAHRGAAEIALFADRTPSRSSPRPGGATSEHH